MIDKKQLNAVLSPNGNTNNNDNSGSGGRGGQLYRVLRVSHTPKTTSVNIYSPSGSLVIGTEERNNSVKRRVVVARLMYLSSRYV